MNPPIKVGLGVVVQKDGKYLMHRRKGKLGGGEYGGIGGHLEYMESFADCAKREAREEAGIEIENIRFLCLSNLKNYAPDHYVDVAVIADWKSGVPQVLEPDKCESWDWYSADNLPQPLFGCEAQYFEALKTGKNYFDV